MNLNPAYYRTRYFGRPTSAPTQATVIYEDPDQALESRNRPRSLYDDHTYITILPPTHSQ